MRLLSGVSFTLVITDVTDKSYRSKRPLRSEEFFELLGSKSSSFGDAPYRVTIDRIGARDRDLWNPVLT